MLLMRPTFFVSALKGCSASSPQKQLFAQRKEAAATLATAFVVTNPTNGETLDFWLGRWKVTNSHGKEVGTSEISRASQGCAIREERKASSLASGISINYYDVADHE